MRAAVRAVLVAGVVLVWLAGEPGADRGAAAAGRWTWPLSGPPTVTRAFTPPAHRYGVGHRGVDLPTTPGAEVRAAGAGRVSYAGLLAGRGVLVVVHGSLRTTYEPVTATVPLGTPVAAGEVVGRVEAGHAGCPARACLHWGLLRGEDYLDPRRLVEPGPVRLLPLGSSGAAAGPVPQAPAAGPALQGHAARTGLPRAGSATAGSSLQAAASGSSGSSAAAGGPAPPPRGEPAPAVPVLPAVSAVGLVVAGGGLAAAAGRRRR